MTRAIVPAVGERRPSIGRLVLVPVLGLSVCALSSAQTTYSIDYRAAQKATPDSCTGTPITEGDILQPGTPGGVPALAPLPKPAIAITSGAAGLGLFGDAMFRGHAEGVHVALEVDALSLSTKWRIPRPGFSPSFS